jgi:hypothetical protein
LRPLKEVHRRLLGVIACLRLSSGVTFAYTEQGEEISDRHYLILLGLFMRLATSAS